MSIEGWELVYKDFGQSTTNGISNPHFILYNRFRGVMRVFYCITKQQSTVTSAMLSVTWNGGKISTMLESGKSLMNSSKTFSKEIQIDVPNKLPINEAFVWQYAEIPVNYDPCTCNSSMNSLGQVTPNVSSYQFGVDFIDRSQSVFEFNRITPDSSKVIVAKDYVRNTGDIFSQILFAGNYLFGKINAGLTRGNKLEKNITETQNSILDGYKHIIDVSNFLNGRDTAVLLSKDVKAPALFKFIPKIGIAVGFLESFFGGGKSADKNNTTNSAVPQNYSLSGTTIKRGISSSKSIYTSGSPHSNITGQNVVKPVYNYIMGTFGLLEEPKLEAVSHKLQANSSNSAYRLIAPRITKYRLKEPIKYAINPASELEVVDIQTALEYQALPNRKDGGIYLRPVDTTHKKEIVLRDIQGKTVGITLPAIGPVFTKPNTYGLSYRERCEKSGVYIANWPKENKMKADPFGNSSLYNITYSTGFFNPACHKQYSFAVADYKPYFPSGAFMINHCSGWQSFAHFDEDDDYINYLDFTEQNLKIVLKVKIILRRTDKNANANTEDIIRILSFDLITPKPYENSELGYNSNYSPDYYFNFQNCDFFGGSNRYGVHYYIQQFAHIIQGGVGAMPLGYGAYEDTVIISNWNQLNQNRIVYARKVIIVKTNVSAPTGYNVILRAGSKVEVDNGGSLDPATVSTEITSDLPGCEGLQTPVDYSYIQSYCSDTSKYYVVFNKMASAPPPSKSDFITTLSLHPNPSTSLTTLTIENPSAEQARVMVYDLVGREVYSQDMKDVSASNNKLEISTDGWNTGIYIVKVIHGEVEKSIKLEVR